MSEPVSNAEVEDVLSSIRRLVSEDKRPKQPSQPASDQAAAPQAAAPSTAPGAAAEATVASGDFTPHVPPSSAAEVAAEGAKPQTPSFTRRGAEAAPRASKERPFFTSRKVMNPPQEEQAPAATDRLVLTPALRVATSDGKDLPQPAGSAPREAEEEISASPAISPYDYDMLHDDPADLHAEDAEATPATAAQTPAFDMADDAGFDPAQFTPVVSDQPQAKLSDKIAALETAIGQISEEWEPDSPGDNDYSGTEPPAMAWEDDEEPEAEAPAAAGPTAPAEPQPQRSPTPEIEEQVRRFADSGPRAPEPAEADAAAGIGIEDQFLDEEALRDLVTEIVRAELQGALGERITRNVRKLVRREIHRALTAQDLE
ncbi:hypothetical protein [Sulfitobacter sp. PS-8MA]|uniref:hypothetical protein n=1 Tax=Sulfitobacter sp. PS-8MA TaxID=3237707 RepID=UPI0034C63B1C